MRETPGNLLTPVPRGSGGAPPATLRPRDSRLTLAHRPGATLRSRRQAAGEPPGGCRLREASMSSAPRHDITRLLQSLRGGDQNAVDALFPLVYDELRSLARRQLARERPGHTLDSVALVNEAYIKLASQGDVPLENRAHFFAVSARAMRAILVDYARARNAAKRGGGEAAVPLDDVA